MCLPARFATLSAVVKVGTVAGTTPLVAEGNIVICPAILRCLWPLHHSAVVTDASRGLLFTLCELRGIRFVQ